MQILGLLGMHFDAAVVFVTNSLLLFRLALAILCHVFHFWPRLARKDLIAPQLSSYELTILIYIL
jgi:hypothetical protein